MFSVEIKSDQVTAALSKLAVDLADMTPVMEDIGEYLVRSTKKRFADGIAPDGTDWLANSAVTLSRKSDPRPLFGTSGTLNQQIFHEAGSDFVEVGSNRVQAAMMQFGGTKVQFPHLWGDIPARPFLGLSEADETNVLDIIEDYLTGSITAGP